MDSSLLIPTADVEELEPGLSMVRYEGDYGFDGFLDQGGAASDDEVIDYLSRDVYKRQVRNREDLHRILGFLDASQEEKDYSILGSFTPQEAEGICVYCNHCQPCPAGLDVGLIRCV